MQNKVSNLVILLTFICSFIFLNCITSKDIYTDSGELIRPTIAVNADPGENSNQSFSQNSITEMKADLVDNVNLPLLYALVRSSNPGLLAKMAKVHEADGQKMQAGVLENPEFRTYINRIPLTSENSIEEGNVRFRILQPIDISGGISADIKIARARHLEATWEMIDAEQRMKILSAYAFVDYWMSKDILDLVTNLKAARTKEYEIVNKEVDSGKSTKVKLLKYHQLLTDASLAYETAKSNVETAKNNMQSLIGDFTLVFGDPEFNTALDFDEIDNQNLAELAKNHPAYMAAMQNVTAFEEEQVKENGKHLKKMKVGLEYEFENDGQNHWMNLIFEVPFPLWDFGKGNKYSAKARVFIAKMQAQSVFVKIQNEIAEAFNRFDSLKSKAQIISEYLVEKRTLTDEIVNGQASVTTLFDALESQAELINYELQALENKLELYKTFFFLYVSQHGKYPEFKD